MYIQEVSLDKALVLTTIFTPCRPGRAPQLSDGEVVSHALYQELIGESREVHFFRL
jgi:hypothetical protein